MNSHESLRILGVFAHPDDETFCAGGTLAKYIAAGAEAMVVSATPGDAGQIRDARVATRRTLGQVRAQELRQACKALGVQHVACLNYGDGTLKDIDRHALVGHVTEIIRTFRPDIVITFGDDGAYGHPDHVAIGAATDEAFRLAGDENHFPGQVGNGLSPHAPARLYHSYFPRSRRLLLEQLVQWLKGLKARFRGTAEFANGLMLFADESTMLGYTSDYIKVGWYPAGFYIIEQGEPATSLFLVLSGQVDVLKEDEDGNVRKVGAFGPGDFFGEEGIAYGKPRSAHIVAQDSVSCLVFSPGEPTAFAGRGEDAQFAFETSGEHPHPRQSRATTCIDATGYVMQKIAAIAAHHTQYPITPGMFPRPMLEELLGREYFVRVYPPLEMETELLPANPC